MHQHTVHRDFHQSRIDVWARHQWPSANHATIQKALRKGWIKVDGKKVSPSTRLQANSHVTVSPYWSHRFTVQHTDSMLTDAWKQRISQWILYEDTNTIVLNKPSGLACQGGSGQKYHIDGLMRHWYKNGVVRLVHRLDQQTSGVLILAKTLSYTRKMATCFQNGLVKKTYWAIVHGVVPAKGVIRTALERRGRIMVPSTGPEALHSMTRYVRKNVANGLSWVEIFPTTGRMHQIRAHMAFIGHPIVGDMVYGPEVNQAHNSELLLHCHHMAWTVDAVTVSVTAPCPSRFDTVSDLFTCA